MWYNVIIAGLLRSPLHGLLSKWMMLISVTGRNSGRLYTLPINYVRHGTVFYSVSFRQRTWWRNLVGGAPVTLLVQGQMLRGIGVATTNPQEIATHMLTLFQHAPQYARHFQVALGPDGTPNPDDLAHMAQEVVAIKTIIE